MNAVLSVFFTAFMAMFKIFLISCVGIVCASYPKNDPLLNRDALRHFSRLNTFLLSPALVIYALGSTLNIQLFIHLSLLFPFALLIIGISYLCGYLLKFIHEDNQVLFKSSLVCVGSPNGISLPLMVMASLCENSDVNADYDGDADLCFEEASSMMFIYVIPWFLVFWSYGYSQLASVNDIIAEPFHGAEEDGDSVVVISFRDKCKVIGRKLWLVFQNPALIGVYIGLFVGLTPGLGSFLFDKMTVAQPFGGAVEVLATPVVALNSLVMSASLAHINIDWADVFPWLKKRNGYAHQDSSHSADDFELEVELEVMDISDVGITRSGCGQRSRTSSKTSVDNAASIMNGSAILCASEEESDEVISSGGIVENVMHGQGNVSMRDNDFNEVCSSEVEGKSLSVCTGDEIEIAQPKNNTIPKFRSIFFIFLCRYTHILLTVNKYFE